MLKNKSIKQEKEPLVTIVLQTYNRQNLLETALNSAKNQTYKNIEILIGDNCSEDNTEEYCLKEAEKDLRIRYFRHKENIGMVNNANFLLDRINGEYFIFLNDDDWLDENYVEKSVKFIHNRKNYSMVCPSTVLYPPNYMDFSKKIGKICKIAKLNSNSVFKRLKEYLINQDSIEMSSGCFRTSVLRDIKDEEGQYIIDRYNEDIVLIMKFLAKGKCKVLPDTHLNKRDGGFSRNLNTTKEVYTVRGINAQNIARRRCQIFSNAIKNDNYFKSLFSAKQLQNLSERIYDTLCWNYCQGKYLNKIYLMKIIRCIKFLFKYRLYKI